MRLTDLRTPLGEDLLTRATELVGSDPLKAATALRASGAPAELTSAALTQATLRAKAVAKFGPDAAGMFFTRAGLEQATRLVVAERRAARLVAAGVTSVIELGCGVGADTRAMARAGIRVYAVDADPETAEIAAANTAGLDVVVECRDALTVDVSTFDVVFCDPARRSGSKRVFDPRAYSPPWEFVLSLTSRPTVLKLAPGIDHALLPANAEAEWVSVDGDVVEAALWCDELAEVPRRATLFRSGSPTSAGSPTEAVGVAGPVGVAGVAEITGSGSREAQVGPVGDYVYDPDGAVLRAHLVAELADTLGAHIADPAIAYLYTDEAHPTPFARPYRIDDVLPFGLKRLRAALRQRGVGRLTIKKRGSALEPERLRKQLRLDGPNEATVILTQVAGAPMALICGPVPSPRS